MADNILTNPYPDLKFDPDYQDARIRAAYHYLGETPNEDDMNYWRRDIRKYGWSGYFWDKMVLTDNGPKPVVNPDPVPYSASTPATSPPSAPPATPVSDARIDVVLQRLIDLQMQLNEVLRTQTPPAPAYQGSIFGIKVVLRPV